MNNIKALSIILLIGVIIGCTKGTPSQTIKKVNVYTTEEEARSEGALNLPEPKAMETLAKGVTVTVLSDHYGKDYWACYIRTASNTEGWVLCTSLNYN